MIPVDSSSWDFPVPKNCDLSIKQPSNATDILSQSLPVNIQRVNRTIVRMPIPPSSGTSVPPDCINALKNVQLPTNFTWRTQGGDQVETAGIRDQGKCGGCWAFAIASVLSDRAALQNQIKAPYLSSTSMISFGPLIIKGLAGCEGNNVFEAADWFGNNNIGLKLARCWPFEVIKDSSKYGAEQDWVAPSPLNEDKALDNCCYNCCTDQVKDLAQTLIYCYPQIDAKNPDIHYIKYFGVDQIPIADYTQEQIDFTIKDIQLNILTDGPVTTSLHVYQDFIDFWANQAPQGKIYTHDPTQTNKVGGHAMVIVGWGEENGVKYWEVRNSWGPTGWNNGYIKMAFSTVSNKDSWIGIDIPLLEIADGNYNYSCGVVSILPKPIDNLSELIQKGIFFPSNAGNLLDKSRALIQGFDAVEKTCPNFNPSLYTSSSGIFGIFGPIGRFFQNVGTFISKHKASVIITVILIAIIVVLIFMFIHKK